MITRNSCPNGCPCGTSTNFISQHHQSHHSTINSFQQSQYYNPSHHHRSHHTHHTNHHHGHHPHHQMNNIDNSNHSRTIEENCQLITSAGYNLITSTNGETIPIDYQSSTLTSSIMSPVNNSTFNQSNGHLSLGNDQFNNSFNYSLVHVVPGSSINSNSSASSSNSSNSSNSAQNHLNVNHQPNVFHHHTNKNHSHNAPEHQFHGHPMLSQSNNINDG